MTILSDLAALYDRRAEREGWPRPGFSTEKIGAEVVLAADGSVTAIRSLMYADLKGKMQPRLLQVPAPPPDRRGTRIVPGNFWDPMPYALGIGGKPDAPDTAADRCEEKFQAFVSHHKILLAESEEAHAKTFLAFLENWVPQEHITREDLGHLIGSQVVFAFEDGRWLHELSFAQELSLPPIAADQAICLVTGHLSSPIRLHPKIKGVVGAQSSGASLVSFNNDAETSHGKSQGENAPTSEPAAFAYGTALNALLARDSGRNLLIGDATVVFWSRAGDLDAETAIEDDFAALWHEGGGRDEETSNEAALRERLTAVAQGKVPDGSALDPAARVFVLGLAPNAARIAVRFWHVDTLGMLARRVCQFWAECAIDPSPFRRGDVERLPKPAALLYDIAPLRERKNIPPNLAGDLMRAILTGLPYPATLLPAVIARLRAEGDPDRKRHGDVDGRRAALIRAVLIRNLKREVPMALSETEDDVAYLLGRLFAAYVYAERSYQKRGAPLRAKYMGSASATPARVFPILMRSYEHDLDALRKGKGEADNPDLNRAAGRKADTAVASVLEHLAGDSLPQTLALEDQGRFFIGFYHQLTSFYTSPKKAVDETFDDAGEGDDT